MHSFLRHARNYLSRLKPSFHKVVISVVRRPRAGTNDKPATMSLVVFNKFLVRLHGEYNNILV